MVLVAFCLRVDANDPELSVAVEEDELPVGTDEEVELVFEALLLFPAIKFVACCLIDQRSMAKAICLTIVLTIEVVKINAMIKLAKTSDLFILIQLQHNNIVFNIR